jgi:catecholate siderophore receptor
LVAITLAAPNEIRLSLVRLAPPPSPIKEKSLIRRGLWLFLGCLAAPAPLAWASADTLPAAAAVAQATLRGRVFDTSRGAIVGARVTVTPLRAGVPVSTVTNQDGLYELHLPAGDYVVRVAAEGFADTTRRLALAPGEVLTTDLSLEVAGIQESVSVGAPGEYAVPAVSSATKTTTPLRDVPQAVSVVSRTLIADQRMSSMADVVRYMPGVGIAQGEGNRDTPILRGNSTTSDFFVDGVRDDLQYFRDLYNVDRVEALKGPNAMIFGRGGVGGVINRVTRQADWSRSREVALQFGSWDNRRLTADLGAGVNEQAAVRVTGLYENSDSYRQEVGVERYGVNPTAAFRLGANTTVRASFEHFHDERTADRGVSSMDGRPLDVAAGTFFGDPGQSQSRATVNLVSTSVEHRFGPLATLRNRLSYGDYDKFYQNVFPGAVDGAARTVAISAYNNATTRQNLFNQTDLIVSARTGGIGHTLLVGAELGRQATSNRRETGFFTSIGASATTVNAPLASPTISLPLTFRQSATDAANEGVATIAAAYAQDQIALSSTVEAVAGVRVDRFQARVTNHRSATTLESSDTLFSPRVGVIYHPRAAVSLYGSYSMTYLPRAGEQLASLSLTNQALEPEEFRNYEVGAKWDLAPALSFTAAVYRLDRGNVAVTDPTDPTRAILVDAQRTAGLELELNGNLTRAWTIVGGYAWQDGEITRSISSTAQAGAVLAQLPAHAFSLWNKYAFTDRLAGGVGVIHRGDAFTSTDNAVVLPAWTRVDAAVFYQLRPTLRLQVNVENLFDEAYFPNAHSNTNITPGSPRALRIALTTHF